ncbi:G2F domain protein, partial [Teladorsagia circumcincta]
LALASDGMISYALIQFLTLSWSASGGRYAQSGFSMSDGRHQGNINSGTPDVKDLVGLSNNPEGTSFIFRISGSSIEDPRENTEEYEYNNYDQTDYDGDERKPQPQPEDEASENQVPEIREPLPPLPRGGASGAHRAPHQHQDSARTDDRQDFAREGDEREHEKDSGVERQPEQEQQRQPEPEREEAEPQSEASQPATNCAAAGTAACHENGVCRDYTDGFCCECQAGYYGNGKDCEKKGEPQRISGSLEGVINGVSIDQVVLHTLVTATDGHAYTALTKIPSDLGHQFLLLNPIGSIMGWLFADVFVSGTLPDIAPGTEIAFPDYEEEYRRERPGLIRSYTGMDVQLKEHGQPRSMRMTIDQQIQYEECPHRPFDKEHAVVLHVKRTHANYVADEGVVRYGSRNYIHSVGESSQTDPRQHPQPQPPAPQQQEANPVGLTSEGVCTNHHQCHQWGECVFADGSPYGQCRCRGWYTGDGVDHCGPPQGEHLEI